MNPNLTRLAIFALIVLLALTWVDLVRLEARTQRHDLALCYSIHDYMVDIRGRAKDRLAKIDYYKHHPAELRAALKDNAADIQRFADICDRLK